MTAFRQRSGPSSRLSKRLALVLCTYRVPDRVSLFIDRLSIPVCWFFYLHFLYSYVPIAERSMCLRIDKDMTVSAIQSFSAHVQLPSP